MTRFSFAHIADQLSAAIPALFHGFRLHVGDPIEVLHHINWSASWTEDDDSVAPQRAKQDMPALIDCSCPNGH